jgi:uncharacterized cupredoxin-like copper-binding protein
MKPGITTIAGIAFALAGATAFAAGSHDGGHGHAAPIGQPGNPAKADRVIEVGMTEMAFHPSTVEISPGETITFVVTNKGKLVHEFNLGTQSTWQAHMDEMTRMMETGAMSARQIHRDRMMRAGMMHDDANSVLLEPGQTADVTWRFGDAGAMGFACNVPGHRASGMVGDFTFATR